jgi:hypothetical protein
VNPVPPYSNSRFLTGGEFNSNQETIKQSSDESRLWKAEGFPKYRMFWLASLLFGLISLANLVCRGTLGSEPSTGFMILAGSGMLGMVMRLRQRHGG